MIRAKTTVLSSLEQFPIWEEDFKTAAKTRGLWKYIRVDDRVPWPEAPVVPELRNFDTQKRANPRIGELTAADQADYNEAMARYDRALREQKERNATITELAQWMRNTVSEHYRFTYMKSHCNIEKWYDDLRKLRGTVSGALKFKYRNEYEAFIANSSQHYIKDLTKWCDQWSEKISKAKEAGAGVTDSYEMMIDVRTALQATRPFWTASFSSIHSSEIRLNKLEYTTVANELRQEAVYMEATKTQNTGRTDRGNGRGTYSKKRTYGERTEAQEDNPNVQDCIVCYGRHKIDNCWFVFPDLRPEGRTINKAIKRIAQQRIQNEPAVKSAIKRAKGSRRQAKRPRSEEEAPGED
ncbi:hypothetical protein GGR50DRAFT_665194 [Xylaria sp. CBS 124048]|nr:hypothetical protein GGR50DRAFT_665194 [Xylaria sp. CBS 124048]